MFCERDRTFDTWVWLEPSEQKEERCMIIGKTFKQANH